MTNYHLEMERIMGEVPAGTPLLLHACCGPCLSAVLERLGGHFAVTVYYYNPNINTLAEYEKRREGVQLLMRQLPTAWPATFLEGAYEPKVFTGAARGMENLPEGGARCTACFELRLFETARMAAEKGFGWFASTLSVSPHKNAALLNAVGGRAAERYGARFLPSDFKKKDGYRRSIALSQQYGLYRQSYCGCGYSLPEGEA